MPVGDFDQAYIRKELEQLLGRLDKYDGASVARYLGRLARVARPAPPAADLERVLRVGDVIRVRTPVGMRDFAVSSVTDNHQYAYTKGGDVYHARIDEHGCVKKRGHRNSGKWWEPEWLVLRFHPELHPPCVPAAPQGETEEGT